MPQLAFDTWISQLIWLGISFAILYLVLSRVALPRIATVIEERRDKIADDLDQAAEFGRRTEKSHKAYEQALSESRGRAHVMAREIRDDLHEETRRQVLETETSLAHKVAAGEARVAQARSEALGRLPHEATAAAEGIVTRVLSGSVDGGKVRLAVDGALEN